MNEGKRYKVYKKNFVKSVFQKKKYDIFRDKDITILNPPWFFYPESWGFPRNFFVVFLIFLPILFLLFI